MLHWQDEKECQNELTLQRATEIRRERKEKEILKYLKKQDLLGGIIKNIHQRKDYLVPDL